MKEIKLSDSQKVHLAGKIEMNVKHAPCLAHPEMGCCWIWQRAIIKDGYGQLYLGERALRAHRASYATYNGDVPDGFCVLHNCDNPVCCNPSHLSIGTVDENVQDRVRKRRGAIGTKINTAKLSEDDIPKIIQLRESGKTLKEVGDMFGVSLSLIWSISKKEIWKHVHAADL